VFLVIFPDYQLTNQDRPGIWPIDWLGCV